MIRRIATTEVADQDVRGIVAYIAIDNSTSASLFADELSLTLERLKANPESGSAVSGFSTPLRSQN